MTFGAQTIFENVNLSIPDNVKIGIVAHRTPQLAFEVITKNISWEKANKCDWRKTGDWQLGWKYNID